MQCQVALVEAMEDLGKNPVVSMSNPLLEDSTEEEWS